MTSYEPAPEPEINIRARLPGPGQAGLLRLAVAPVLLAGAVVVGLAPELPAETQRSPASNPPEPTILQESPDMVVAPTARTILSDALPLLRRSGNRVRMADVVMRFDVPTQGWESHGLPYVSKSHHGSQGAEAIVYWTALPRGHSANPCPSILGRLAGATPQSLAQAVTHAPAVTVLSGPMDGMLGGGVSTYVEVRVERQRGCIPGHLVEWEPFLGGALWEDVHRGDTIRAWFVDVQGTIIIVAAATHADAGQSVTREALTIVDSITFNVIPA